MATIYKIEIETVSPFVAYDEKTIADLFRQFIDDNKTKVRLENTTIKVTQKKYHP